jgi:hypothetical protein
MLTELVERWCSDNTDLAVPSHAWGKCAIASGQLAEFLRSEGVEASQIRMTGLDYPRREHWAVWVEAEEVVIDVTARQFNPLVEFPLVRGLWEWGDEGCEWLVDGLRLDCFPFHRVLDVEPLWSEQHVREDIESGEMVYPSESLTSP